MDTNPRNFKLAVLPACEMLLKIVALRQFLHSHLIMLTPTALMFLNGDKKKARFHEGNLEGCLYC